MFHFFLQFKLTVPKTGGVADLCEVLSQFVQVKPEFVSIIEYSGLQVKLRTVEPVSSGHSKIEKNKGLKDKW